MNITEHQAEYFAHELDQAMRPDSIEKLAGRSSSPGRSEPPPGRSRALCVRSPLSKGALLADEVGLGKTIEAGLVISQRWAERKRRILVITPVEPSQAVASGIDREILSSLPDSGIEIVQRGDPKRHFRAVCDQPELL